jgi:hypothetical protein
MTTRQVLRLSMPSVAIDRTNGVDHVFRSQASTRSDDSFPSRQASDLTHNLPAFGKYRGSAGVMNGAVDPASAQKR